MDTSLLMKKGALAGAVCGVVLIVLNLLSFIPLVGCVTGIVACVVAFMPGVVGSYLLMQESSTTTTGEGAITGAVSGAVASLLSSVVVIPVMAFTGAAASLGGRGGMEQAALGGGMIFVVGIIGAIIGLVILSGINAGTGALYVLIKNR